MTKHILSIIAGCIGLAAIGNVYAFMPDRNSCQPYINAGASSGNPNASYYQANKNNIKACLSSCDNIYGSGIDKSTLDAIALCKKNISSLIFKGDYVSKLGSSGTDTSTSNVQTQPQTNDTQKQTQTIPSAPLKSTSPDLTKPKKKNDAIKWF